MLRATTGARREGATADTDASRELGTACSEEKGAAAPTATGHADGDRAGLAQSVPAAWRGAEPAQRVIADSSSLQILMLPAPDLPTLLLVPGATTAPAEVATGTCPASLESDQSMQEHRHFVHDSTGRVL